MVIDTDWKEALPTLGIGVAGAFLFWLIGFPAAVLTGPAAAVSLATILGVPTAIPVGLRDAVFVVIGSTIGSTVTPEVIATALAWPLSLLVLTVTLFATLIVAQTTLMRGFAYDRMTALLSATPGHLSYVLSMSTEVAADVRRVALVQTVRVLMLTLLVPVLISLWGVKGTAQVAQSGPISPIALALTFSLAIAAGLLLKRLAVPAPLLIGAMTVSAIAHGANLTPGTIPPWLTVIAFICMGSLIGTRFRGFDRGQLAGALFAGIVMTLIACVFAALGAMIAARLVGLPSAVLLLAFAPGGVEVMAALAVETGLEPAFVAAHHVFRLLVLGVLIPPMIARNRSS
ncbi:AbrB family transcriptional regulator [Yoonia sp.]|uniref:AbrB family transcriptional regulator n=1 Tax=Yoonia sp. TaxID=2212373 RepID=UPI0025ECE653|nr:AbrB family transcriptional regulator [Yoonia sp.]